MKTRRNFLIVRRVATSVFMCVNNDGRVTSESCTLKKRKNIPAKAIIATKTMRKSTTLYFITLILPAQSFQAGNTNIKYSQKTTSRLKHSYSYDGFLWDDMTPKRRERIAREESLHRRFATGKELKNLRNGLKRLRENLMWATALHDEDRMDELKKAIQDGEKMDPQHTYERSLNIIKEAESSTNLKNKEQIIRKWTKEAEAARSCIERFHFDGLWVGK